MQFTVKHNTIHAKKQLNARRNQKMSGVFRYKRKLKTREVKPSRNKPKNRQNCFLYMT